MASNKLPIFPTIGKNFKESFLELYSSLGFTLLVSLVWFVCYLPILFFVGALLLRKMPQPFQPGEIMFFVMLFLFLFFIWNSLLAGPVFGAAYGLYQERKEDYASFKMYFRIFKKYYRISVGIWGTFSLVFSILFLNIVIALMGRQTLVMVAGAISVYMMFFILLMSFYFNPLIQLGNSWKKVIRKSFLLVLDNFGLSIWFMLVLTALLVLSIYIPFIFVMFYGAMLIYFTDKGFGAVYNKYDS